MARIARVIAPGLPHYLTQRGNRSQRTFFSQDDYQAYVDLLSERCKTYRVRIWAWCLMPNHVHIIAVPKTEDGLRLAIGKTHRHYSRRVNFRKGWRGHLWQGRFASFPMDKTYLWEAARYIELNPLRAGLVERPEDWPWSSARSRIMDEADPLLSATSPFEAGTEEFADWREFLDHGAPDEQVVQKLQMHERTGRPLGGKAFLKSLSKKLNRDLLPKRPGPKPKNQR